MNKLIRHILFVAILCSTACRSWHIDEHSNPNRYTGFYRSFDMTEWKYRKDENRWYRLELYNDGKFIFSEIAGSHICKYGKGVWREVGDYVILDFSLYDKNRKRREFEESLAGYTTIKDMCVVLKKKGKEDLKILSGNAVLRCSK